MYLGGSTYLYLDSTTGPEGLRSFERSAWKHSENNQTDGTSSENDSTKRWNETIGPSRARAEPSESFEDVGQSSQTGCKCSKSFESVSNKFQKLKCGSRTHDKLEIRLNKFRNHLKPFRTNVQNSESLRKQLSIGLWKSMTGFWAAAGLWWSVI